ncbi:DUF4177 domain-containing protein [Bacillus sp. 1P10SD]|uniref:DUF4177 domain-containing protein n=1 Tax=Bacillus sp. 1P10SD TaxID=3132265 RepID=UPI0039A4BE5E
MYDYKFVRVEIDRWKGKPTEDYQKIISEHAEDGWKFVQIFAPPISGFGAANYFDIIFELEKQ